MDGNEFNFLSTVKTLLNIKNEDMDNILLIHIDITKNSIKTMLEMNYNYSGIEYGINDSMKTQVMVYLQDINDNAKMFEVCITYNEFSRNPDAFKKFIEEPKVQKKWNFWSRRKKYNQKY